MTSPSKTPSAPETMAASDIATMVRRVDIGARVRDDERPRLSIAIPTFRRFDLLPEALASVFRLRFAIPIEVLVVDNDPENDATAIEAMRPFIGESLSYFKNRVNIGMFPNWTRCIDLARGDFVTILHDDDLLEPAFAEEVNRWLGAAVPPGAAMAWRHGMLDERAQRPAQNDTSSLHRLQAWLAPMRRQVKRKSVAHLFFANPFAATLGIVLDRRKAQALGGFDPAWYPIADYEFWCRWAAVHGPIPIAKRQVSLYRMRQNESMLPETRGAFVTKSRELRERLVSQGLVPAFYGRLLDRLERQQQAAIEEDWRVAGQAPLSPWASAKIVGWRAVTALLSGAGARLARRGRRETSSS